MPPEWLAEIEWRVCRPLGFDGCWFMTTRQRPKTVLTKGDQQFEFKKNPLIRVVEFYEKKGWRNRVVRARPWIAEIFYEWDGLEDPASGFVEGFTREDTGTRVHFEHPRSHWQVKMACKDTRCINPAHMVFEPSGGKNVNTQPDQILIVRGEGL